MSKVSFFNEYGDEFDRLQAVKERTNNDLRVAIPAQIIDINYDAMTCSCQPLIREKMKDENGEIKKAIEFESFDFISSKGCVVCSAIISCKSL